MHICKESTLLSYILGDVQPVVHFNLEKKDLCCQSKTSSPFLKQNNIIDYLFILISTLNALELK